MRSPLFILIAAFLVTLLIAQQFGGMVRAGVPADGVDVLLTLTRRSPELATALAVADRGDAAPLMAWLNAAPALDRQAVAGITMAVAFADAGLRRDDRGPAADAALYRYRTRLTAFTNISTGDEDLDHTLDNLLAYVLVAGTPQPTAEDLALARRLVPRLEKRMTVAPASAVWDTIGCVRFTAGDLAGARSAFDEAVRLGRSELARASGEELKDLQQAMPLYLARQEAAGHADRRSVENRGAPAAPPRLPLAGDLPPATPVERAAHPEKP